MKDERTRTLETEFPAWQVWRSRQGRYWGATHREPKPSGDSMLCWDSTVIEDSEEELRATLTVQTQLISRHHAART
jgi:hypothetical protein